MDVANYLNRKILFSEVLYNDVTIQGNYMIYDRDDVPVYSGQSCNLLERLGCHRKWVGVGYYARILQVCTNREDRLIFEDDIHDKYPNLLSNKRNGKLPVKCIFDGVEFESKRIMYRYIEEYANISTPTAKKYISEGAKTIKDVKAMREANHSSTTKSISESNKRRTGTKHNMVHKTCPHCGVSGSGGNMTRYHFNNCKRKGGS